MKTPFTFDGNLDDQEEANEFIAKHGTTKGRTLANRLGFHGRGAVKAANALSNYAWNKVTAISCRLKADVSGAIQYESICDRIYSQDISGKIECW